MRGRASTLGRLFGRLTGIFAACLLVTSGPLRAETYGGGLPLVEQARSEVTGAIAGILTSNCIAPDAPRPYDLTYLGLPAGDPHVGENVRSRLNSALQEAISTSGLAINVNTAENARVLVPILGSSIDSSRRLEQVVNRLYASTFAVAVQASRPSVDVARLSISIFARSDQGSYNCNRTVTLDVDLASFTVIDNFRGSGDLVELSGAYQASLAAIAPKLKDAKSLRFRPSMNLDGSCQLSLRASDTFTTAYFQLQDGDFAAWLDGTPLPSLRSGGGSSPGDGITMDVVYRMPQASTRIIDLTITISSGEDVIARRRILAIVDEGILDGCRPASAQILAQSAGEPVNGDQAAVSDASPPMPATANPAARADQARPQVAALETGKAADAAAPGAAAKAEEGAKPADEATADSDATDERSAGGEPAATNAADKTAGDADENQPKPVDLADTGTSAASQADASIRKPAAGVPDTVAADAEAGQPQRYLFIIANHDYKYAEAVRYAENDAASIEKLFTEEFGLAPANITRYDDLTKAELEYLFGDSNDPGVIGNQITARNAEVYVYFVGHGSRAFLAKSEDATPYLLGSDSRPDRLDLTGYDLNLLTKQLAAMRERSFPQGRAILFLESCFSGRSDAGDLVTGISAPNSGAAPVIKAEKGVTIVAAAHSDQVAVWDSDYRHGVFTDALVSAFYGEADQTRFGGNDDGVITVGELEKFLQNRMSRRIKQVRPEFRQTPEITGAEKTDILFRLPEDGVAREESTEREHYELLTAREILEANDLAGVQPYLRNCIYCPMKDELRELVQTERRREAVCRAEQRHAADLAKSGSALEISAYLQSCDCCQNSKELKDKLASLSPPDPRQLKDEALWAAAKRDGTIDAFWFYNKNCEDCSNRVEGEKKVAEICQRAQDTVDAQWPADKSYDGLLRYLASCNDMPQVCGSCRRMSEAIKLVAEIESRPDFSSPAKGEVGVPAHATPAETPDQTAYKSAMLATEAGPYDAFLQAYPTSVYVPEIKARLTRLLSEEADWEEVSNTHTIEGYRRYMLQYPSGKHMQEARDRIDLLGDEADWQQVLVERSRDALVGYLSKRPTGRYSDEARRRLREFDEAG